MVLQNKHKIPIVGSSRTEEDKERYVHQFICKAPLTREEDRKSAQYHKNA